MGGALASIKPCGQHLDEENCGTGCTWVATTEHAVTEKFGLEACMPSKLLPKDNQLVKALTTFTILVNTKFPDYAYIINCVDQSTCGTVAEGTCQECLIGAGEYRTEIRIHLHSGNCVFRQRSQLNIVLKSGNLS